MLMLFGQRRPRNVRKVPLRQRLTLAWQALSRTTEPTETEDEAAEAPEPRFLWSRIFTVLVVVVCLTLVVAVLLNLGDYLKEKPDTGNVTTFDVSGKFCHAYATCVGFAMVDEDTITVSPSITASAHTKTPSSPASANPLGAPPPRVVRPLA